MKKKLTIFAVCSFVVSLLVFGFSYVLFHHLTPEGNFTSVWSEEPGKPLVTELFAILGVMFLFSGLVSMLARIVFFGSRKNEDG